ncbi:MAG: phosphoribosyltransferase domain-containing protein [Alicyclobacillus sp.]|nr:phosphoribosyltransferase domain-containing protein [Alicyclobacillus sp.]
MRHVYLDYNSIALKLDALAGEVARAGFQGLVAILRGGSFPGVHLAFLTELPVYFLRYDRALAQAEWCGPAPAAGQQLLLCEDFAGSGRTLIDCRQFLADRGYRVSTLVVCQDRLSASVPDYSCFDFRSQQVRVILPWERHRLNPAVDSILLPHDSDYEKVAWDMDGVFLEDVDGALYAQDLERALSLRDEMAPAVYAPQVLPGDCIVTGRPVEDEARTRAWLQAHGFDVPVYFRDDGVAHPTAASTGGWKAAKALEMGCTHFVESDAAQAIAVAAAAPELRVVWWNAGHPMLVQAGPTVLHRNTDKGEGV